MLAKDERHSSGLAEAAIGEADSVGFDVLGRRGLVSVCGHVHISFGWAHSAGCDAELLEQALRLEIGDPDRGGLTVFRNEAVVAEPPEVEHIRGG